ncbi:MAG: hypothetical protein U0105_12965 [Candidatus Obscuribacterales bacterium]
MSAVFPPLRSQAVLLIVMAGVALVSAPFRAHCHNGSCAVLRVVPVVQVAPEYALQELTPAHARNFVRWVMPYALNFSPSLGHSLQQEALSWCLPAAAQDLTKHFYIHERLDQDDHRFLISSMSEGTPNADGSMSVDIDGAFVRMSDEEPELALHIKCDVTRDTDGFRIARVFVTDDPQATRVKSVFEHNHR